MVKEKIDYLSKYKNVFDYTEERDVLSSETTLLSKSDSVVLFFSFDIVNSTAYKTVNYYGWSVVIDHIISELRIEVKNKIPRAELWRILGDEVIFIVDVCDREFIFEYISSIYSILIDFVNDLEEGTFFDKIENFSGTIVNLMKVENIISLQACAWIAAVTDKMEIKDKSYSGYVENLFEIIEESKNIKFYEFIGIDIDTGFRLSEQTREKRLVLSFELAYMLSKRPDFSERLNIITYRKLKGVWNGDAYPIIWYYDKSKHGDRAFRNSFPFDAVDKDEIYIEFLEKRVFANYMYNNAKEALKKILLDKRFTQKIERIQNIIDKSKNTYKQFIDNPRLELHCVAVCYNDEGKILIAKRDGREILESKWEFGCAKANSRKELAESIKEEYKKDFGIIVEPFMDVGRQDLQPVPLAVYKIEKQDELHKGIIFLAKIISGDVILDSNKHCAFRMISEDEIDSLNVDECVPDMKATLKLAFEKIKGDSR